MQRINYSKRRSESNKSHGKKGSAPALSSCHECRQTISRLSVLLSKYAVFDHWTRRCSIWQSSLCILNFKSTEVTLWARFLERVPLWWTWKMQSGPWKYALRAIRYYIQLKNVSDRSRSGWTVLLISADLVFANSLCLPPCKFTLILTSPGNQTFAYAVTNIGQHIQRRIFFCPPPS